MNIIVCCKFVPYLQDIEINPDKTVNFDKAEWEVSEFDRQAVEAGVQLAKQTGGKLIALSVGTERIKTGQLKKDLLSRGPDELYLVCDEKFKNADTGLISKTLKAAIEKIGADVVICGEGSADLYYRQTGLQLGERLGWATLNMVNSIEYSDDKLVVERVTETRVDTLEMQLPALVSVTSTINTPPLPNIKAVFSANKKPLTVLTMEELGLDDAENGLNEISTLAPEYAERKNVVFKGEPIDEMAAELVKSLRADGVL